MGHTFRSQFLPDARALLLPQLQLTQTPGPDSPILLSSDRAEDCLLAKRDLSLPLRAPGAQDSLSSAFNRLCDRLFFFFML